MLTIFCSPILSPHFSLPPSTSDSNNNWGPFPYTSRGSLLLREECVTVEKDLRRGRRMAWWEMCGRSQARYGSGKTNQECKGSWSNKINSLVVFFFFFRSCFKVVVTFLCILVLAHPCAFCSLLLPLGGSHLSSLIVKTPAFQWPSCTLAKL